MLPHSRPGLSVFQRGARGRRALLLNGVNAPLLCFLERGLWWKGGSLSGTCANTWDKGASGAPRPLLRRRSLFYSDSVVWANPQADLGACSLPLLSQQAEVEASENCNKEEKLDPGIPVRKAGRPGRKRKQPVVSGRPGGVGWVFGGKRVAWDSAWFPKGAGVGGKECTFLILVAG